MGSPNRRAHIAALVLAMIVSLVACQTGDERPSRLFDGTPAPDPPVTLEGVSEAAVLTRVAVTRSPPRQDASRSCLAEQWEGRTATVAVARVGVRAESVTLFDSARRALLACDGSGDDATARWCGAAYGPLREGRLQDPRLDILCGSAENRAIGFAWVLPEADARFVVVRQSGFAEAYETAAGLPVRVSTTDDVDAERSSATFDVSEHDMDGRLLRRYELGATVAG